MYHNVRKVPRSYNRSPAVATAEQQHHRDLANSSITPATCPRPWWGGSAGTLKGGRSCTLRTGRVPVERASWGKELALASLEPTPSGRGTKLLMLSSPHGSVSHFSP